MPERSPIGIVRIVIAAAVTIPMSGVGGAEPSAAVGGDRRPAELIELAMASQESLWRQIGTAEPGPTLSSRALFSAAHVLCAARRHPERLGRLFELARQMQDDDPASPGYGNFRWYWRDERVTDPNAVEFCGFDMHLIRRLHGDWLPQPARDVLEPQMTRAIDGCLRHPVRPSYTNIAILNAANLITLGEMSGRADAAEEGYRRLEAVAADVWRFGLHEYCSPTYYAVDVRGLSIIERFAERRAGRDLARALLELVWTDIAVNFLPAAERLAGTHSRSYDYPRGLGGLQQDLRWVGWSRVPPLKSIEALHVAQGTWAPSPELLELASTRFPRLVREAWGPRLADSRTHWLLADVTLGCSGAGYGPHDCPLTFDFSGPPGSIRGYFLPDGREDPYGQKKYGDGAARHPKALHLVPFWAGAQREADALGLVVYRDADLTAPETINLQSHFVLPRDVDGVWVRGEKASLPPPAGDGPGMLPIASGDPIVIRKGSSAVGMRLVWARAQDGLPATAALVDDGNRLGAIRLTVEHRHDAPSAEAGAAFWVRVGGGLEADGAFETWRTSFERATPVATEVTDERIVISVPGCAGPVSINAEAPFTAAGRVRIDPAPSRAVLELDGDDIGRKLLAQVEPCASIAAATGVAIDVPRAGGVRIEAEDGVVLPRMEVSDDGHGTRSVWQPDDGPPVAAAGATSWTVLIPAPGRYWLWGRVLAPDGKRDSFTLSVGAPDGTTIREGPWHLPRAAEWRWRQARIGADQAPTPFELPAGQVRITISTREAGTRLDAIWLTADPRAQPD